MVFDPYKALYIHIPFCKKRCRYCDFSTEAVDVDSPLIDDYVEQLILDIRHAGKEGKLSAIETVYLGGGTPSYIGLKRLAQILYTLGLSMHLTDEVEVSMEANPESLTEPMVRDIWALGVNRLSIGVQSLHDDVLQRLGRIHDAHRALEAIEIAQTRFENVSVDMMCAIPGQTGEMFCEDLQRVVDAGVKHVSVYPLTVEEGTAFDDMVRAGLMEEAPQDDQALFMAMAASVLEPAGLQRYEVASYARPGFACRHNQAYWTGKPYLGFGPSAVTMTQNDQRRMRIQDGEVVDDLDRRQMCAEDLMLKMRMSCGISDEDVASASLLLPDLPRTIHDLELKSIIEHVDGRWIPTLGGWLCGNELYGEMYALAP